MHLFDRNDSIYFSNIIKRKLRVNNFKRMGEMRANENKRNNENLYNGQVVFNGGDLLHPSIARNNEIVGDGNHEMTRGHASQACFRAIHPISRKLRQYGFYWILSPTSRPGSIVLKLMLNMAENLPSLCASKFFFFFRISMRSYYKFRL